MRSGAFLPTRALIDQPSPAVTTVRAVGLVAILRTILLRTLILVVMVAPMTGSTTTQTQLSAGLLGLRLPLAVLRGDDIRACLTLVAVSALAASAGHGLTD